jgi:hypothetical protein
VARKYFFDNGKLIVVAGILTLATSPAMYGQSLDVHHPAQLQEGLNNGVIDSFGSDQFWCFTARPGSYKAVFTRNDPQEGFSVGPKAGCGAIINPAVKGSTIATTQVPTGVVIEGHCESPTRILIMVEPAKSPLVRQTNSYTLTVSGSSSGSETAADSQRDQVVGVYDVNNSNYGVAKFAADGSIATTSGAGGKWTLFDDATRTYVVSVGADKWNLTFEPARGFVDKNGVLMFTMKKVVH